VFSKVAETSSAKLPPLNAVELKQQTKRALEVLADGVRRIYQPAQDESQPGAGGAVVVAPFFEGSRCCGVIEAVLPPGHDAEAAAAIVEDFALFASGAAPPEKADADGSRLQFVEKCNHLALELHRGPSVHEVALSAVNEGRILLACDRMALAFKRHKKTEIVAISGQERVVTRSKLVDAMTELAEALLPMAKPFVFAGDCEALPPEVQRPLLKYMRESGSQRLETAPLLVKAEATDGSEAEPAFEPCGILLIDAFQSDRLPVNPAEIDIFASHVALALVNACRYEQSTTLWHRALRRFFAPAETRNLRQAAVYAMLVFVTLMGLAVVPMKHSVSASGRLLPVRRNVIFAPTDARVVEVLVDTNQRVAKGDILLRLSSDRLESELLAARHQLDQKKQLLATLQAQAGVKNEAPSDVDQIRLAGSIAQTKVEIESLSRRLELLQAEARDLEVRSPLTGVVATFDPRRRLQNRPVPKGEELLEVMDASGPWELRLDLPAQRAGDLLQSQSASGESRSTVSFKLAAQPQHSLTGILRRIGSRTTVDADSELVVPLEVDVAVSDIPSPVAGAEVLAQVDCGYKPLWFVLFGDVVNFFRRLWWW
jgi:multidrug efflux pump subunit AcrA (membrane-fusion protein)